MKQTLNLCKKLLHFCHRLYLYKYQQKQLQKGKQNEQPTITTKQQ